MKSPNRAPTDKSTVQLTVNSSTTLQEATTEILAKYSAHKFLVLTIRPGKDRSLDQNRLWRRMYIRIAQVTAQGTDNDAWAYCKLMIGVPILCRDCEQFAKGWKRYFADKSFEEQLFLMGPNPLFGPHGFPVTSLFGTAQGSEYTKAICDHYAPYNVFFDDLLSENK